MEALSERIASLELSQAKIITKLEATVDNLSDNLVAMGKLLEKHNDTLFGEADNNGLRGRVSKLEHQVGTAKWFVGIAATAIAGCVSFIASLLKGH